MKEDDEKTDRLERAKALMAKVDPALLSAALSEMMMEADEAEEADAEKVKEAIKRIYDSIPEGKDKQSILSKAVKGLGSEIIEKEVKAVKENLAGIDKETIREAAKDYVDIVGRCTTSIVVQPACEQDIRYEPCDCIKFLVRFCRDSCVFNVNLCPGGCLFCVGGQGCIKFCLGQNCITFCVGNWRIGCPAHTLYAMPEPGIPSPEIIDPQFKEQLKEEIIQEMLERPELSRAMKKMLKKIQDEK